MKMKQVKVFTGYAMSDLEREVNEFLAFHPVSVEDIQYSTTGNGVRTLIYSAMIVYDSSYASLDAENIEYYKNKKSKAGETE